MHFWILKRYYVEAGALQKNFFPSHKVFICSEHCHISCCLEKFLALLFFNLAQYRNIKDFPLLVTSFSPNSIVTLRELVPCHIIM